MRNDHSPQPRRSLGKRLATYIVVVLILGVLAALLMPALSRSREAARRATDESEAIGSVRTLQSTNAWEVQEQRDSSSLSQDVQSNENAARYLITDINNSSGGALWYEAESSRRGAANTGSTVRSVSHFPKVVPGTAVSVSPLPEDQPVSVEPLRYFGPNYPGGELYEHQKDNPYRIVMEAPLSTFSIDVDTASYTNIRRFLGQHQLPPRDSVRIEELINYFDYRYPQPSGIDPFSVTVDISEYPGETSHWLARIGLKGREAPERNREAANLVFLIDVSGSMQPSNKLPLIQRSMRYLVNQLRPDDRVAMVTYAGSSRVALQSTPVGETAEIVAAIDSLTSGGSTHGSAGIRDAYRIARQHFVSGGINRVILATDGDFNVGITDRGDLMHLIQNEAKSNVFLTVLGFGMGNYKDATLETIADRGNGTYHYVDNFQEAQKIFGTDLTRNLMTIAKDVKIQVEFNPARIQAYRLIGYENRKLAAKDFNDDTKDAGEIGAGHTVTALYELIPVGAEVTSNVDPLRYQSEPAPKAVPADPQHARELMTVKLRYKEPEADRSRRIEMHVPDAIRTLDETPADFRFAASVAIYGMILRNAPEAGSFTLDQVLRLAEPGLSDDPHGYRAEYVDLVRKTKELMPNR